MKTITVIDPGMSTGVVEAEYNDGSTTIKTRQQIEGGLEGFSTAFFDGQFSLTAGVVLVEKFHPRQMARSYKLDELEPLRIEGWIDAMVPLSSELIFQLPEERKLINGEMSDSDGVLKRMGLWTLPSQVGCKDANDANAAMMHLVAFLRNSKHTPILESLFEANTSDYTKA